MDVYAVAIRYARVRRNFIRLGNAENLVDRAQQRFPRGLVQPDFYMADKSILLYY